MTEIEMQIARLTNLLKDKGLKDFNIVENYFPIIIEFNKCTKKTYLGRVKYMKKNLEKVKKFLEQFETEIKVMVTEASIDINQMEGGTIYLQYVSHKSQEFSHFTRHYFYVSIKDSPYECIDADMDRICPNLDKDSLYRETTDILNKGKLGLATLQVTSPNLTKVIEHFFANIKSSLKEKFEGLFPCYKVSNCQILDKNISKRITTGITNAAMLKGIKFPPPPLAKFTEEHRRMGRSFFDKKAKMQSKSSLQQLSTKSLI